MLDSLNYMIAGYVLALLIMGSFVMYVVVRQRQLKAESAELKALLDENTKS
jgi:hypothetical protein